MSNLPKAVEQAIYIHNIGESYFANCHKCKKQIDAFNFTTDWKKGNPINFDDINIICIKCKK